MLESKNYTSVHIGNNCIGDFEAQKNYVNDDMYIENTSFSLSTVLHTYLKRLCQTYRQTKHLSNNQLTTYVIKTQHKKLINQP